MNKVTNDNFSIIIRENSLFKGTLSTQDSIKISGNYTGKIFSSKKVFIDSTAKIFGDIEAESIIIAGIVKGNIKAKEKTHLTSTSKLEGDIITGSFRIDKGGFFRGQCRNIESH